MKKIYTSENTAELIIYAFIWGILIFMPVFLSQGYVTNGSKVYHEWIRLVPFFLIFLVNNFLLVPRYLFNNQRKTYFILAIVSVLIISYLGTFNRVLHDVIVEPNLDNPFPPPPGRRPAPIGSWYATFFMNTVVAFLVVGFNTAIKMSSKWLKAERKREALEKERTQTELAFLRHQVSPHFFMNTLNNIHALIDFNTENAKEAVVQLSQMMRYLLYDSEKKVFLKKEIEFLKSYIDLMRLRVDEEVKIKFTVPKDIPDQPIPPLLFISFVENAFKHGISYRENAFVHIDLSIENDHLIFETENKIFSKEGENIYSGIGLENSRKRLDLLYGNKYDLNISEIGDHFKVTLIIPLGHD
ncbi:MAG: histidine kinase [Bacteroidetes bacterium]|nr:histidine kinase [Bacteroidota bacterium]